MRAASDSTGQFRDAREDSRLRVLKTETGWIRHRVFASHSCGYGRRVLTVEPASGSSSSPRYERMPRSLVADRHFGLRHTKR
jgi:hypothetical protein